MKNYIITLCFISISFCQVFSHYDYTGSRATSMSGAITSGPGTLDNIFHNPAQLSELNGINVVSGYSQIFNLNFLPYYNFGISYESYAINFEKLSTEINGHELSSESVLGIAKGFTVYKDRQSNLQAGLRFNLYQYDLGQSSGSEGDGSNGIMLGSDNGYGLDFGFQGSLNDRYYIAYYLQNIYSSNIGYGLGSELPTSMSIGLSYRPYEDLLTSFDINQLSGHTDQEVRIGIEYLLSDNWILRTGIQNNPNRFSIGFEYNLFDFGNISYGLITHHVMPITHQITFSTNLK